MKNKIVVSMTSYPARIMNVDKSICLLLEKQTVKPDEIHLWLSIEEFPNKEKDLPDGLNNIINSVEKVKLHWLEKNTYVHKRHEIFKIVEDDTFVFLVDDELRYEDNLIETVLEKSAEYPNTIVGFNLFCKHTYKDKKSIYTHRAKKDSYPTINKFRWCGQSMIPSNIYPKECLTKENQEIRDRTSPVSDECWLQPWIVKYDIPIVFCDFMWGRDIDPENGQSKGMSSWCFKSGENGLTIKDNWLFAVLTAYPEMMKKYETLFNYGNKQHKL